MCNQEYEPDQVDIDAWGRSGEDFDPMDWECDYCRDAQDRLAHEEDRFSDDMVDWPERMTGIGEPVMQKSFSLKTFVMVLAWRAEYRIKKWWWIRVCGQCNRPYGWPFDHRDCIPF